MYEGFFITITIGSHRKDKTSGYVVASTTWVSTGSRGALKMLNYVALVKLSDSLSVEWNRKFGLAGGHSQVFDILVDNDGNYLLGGHTTVGTGVVNWDYLALKVDTSGNQIWRKTFGQPRGFDARFVYP